MTVFGCFGKNSYKFATYFYRREFTRLYFCHIVDIVDNGCQRDTRVDRILNRLNWVKIDRDKP